GFTGIEAPPNARTTVDGSIVRAPAGARTKRAEGGAAGCSADHEKNGSRVSPTRTPTEENEMSNKLFVGGLSWDTNDEGLRNAFSEHGPALEAQVVVDRAVRAAA